MRVCFFVPTFLPDLGGIALNTHGLALALEEAGCGVSILAPLSRTQGENPKVPYRLRRYRMPLFKGWGAARLLLSLWAEKRGFGFDILHCHGLDPTGYIGALLKALTSTPLVVTPRKVSVLIPRKGWHHRHLERRMERILTSADRVTAISSPILRILMDLGLPESSIVTIPNGVDFLEFSRRREGGSDSSYILALGRFMRFKGFDLLISAFGRIQEDFPEVKLVIAGGGKKEGELKSLVTQLRLESKVVFPGMVQGDEKVKLLQNCLFLVFPSRGGIEGFGNVILEAMAAGRPVVATDVGGARDVINHGEDGLLVSPDDPDSLAKGLRRMLEKPEEREVMAERAAARAKSFDFSKIAERYLALYQELLDSRGKRPGEDGRP